MANPWIVVKKGDEGVCVYFNDVTNEYQLRVNGDIVDTKKKYEHYIINGENSKMPIVILNGKYGAINWQGEEVVPCKFDLVEKVEDSNLFICYTDKDLQQFEVYDTNGKRVSEEIYSHPKKENGYLICHGEYETVRMYYGLNYIIKDNGDELSEAELINNVCDDVRRGDLDVYEIPDHFYAIKGMAEDVDKALRQYANVRITHIKNKYLKAQKENPLGI